MGDAVETERDPTFPGTPGGPPWDIPLPKIDVPPVMVCHIPPGEFETPLDISYVPFSGEVTTTITCEDPNTNEPVSTLDLDVTGPLQDTVESEGWGSFTGTLNNLDDPAGEPGISLTLIECAPCPYCS